MDTDELIDNYIKRLEAEIISIKAAAKYSAFESLKIHAAGLEHALDIFTQIAGLKEEAKDLDAKPTTNLSDWQ